MGIPQGYLSRTVLREWMTNFVLEVFLIGSCRRQKNNYNNNKQPRENILDFSWARERGCILK